MAGAAFQLEGPGQAELVHVSDETWIGAPALLIGTAVADPALWEAFWPGLRPQLSEARGSEGVRVALAGTRWHGTGELYIHAALDGAVLFHFLRLDPLPGRRIGARAVRLERVRCSRVGRAAAWHLKDEVEALVRPSRRGTQDRLAAGAKRSGARR